MPPSALPPFAGLPSALLALVLLAPWGAPAQARNLSDNGRCDDLRYETSNGGRAEKGTDEYDCSRWGNGLKGRYSEKYPSPDSDAYRSRFYVENGRCDDPRYETSNHGRAEPGTDEYDCSRYGHGLKGAYRKR